MNNELINKESSPITYWLGTTWPQLAKLALDIYAIPVMSDEPERVYSTTGAAGAMGRQRRKAVLGEAARWCSREMKQRWIQRLRLARDTPDLELLR